MAISTRTRFEILKRDGFRCRYCGADPTKGVLHVDHVIAVANGGTDDPANLVASCRSCNLGKSAVPLEERKFAPPVSPEELLEQAEQIRRYLGAQKKVASARRSVVNAALAHCEQEFAGDYPREFEGKIRTALRDLSLDEVMEAITITAERKRQAYPKTQCMYLSGVLRTMRLQKKCSAHVFRLIQRLRFHGCKSLRAVDGKIGWDGPELTPDLDAEVQAHFQELLAVL